MILQALAALADREGLVTDPDYEVRPVAWIIVLRPDGTAIGDPISTSQPDPSAPPGRSRERPKSFLVPRQPTRSGRKAPPGFLVDNAKYVFGLPTPDKHFEPEEGRKKSAWFREEVEACANRTSDPGAVAVARFLENTVASGGKLALPASTKSNDLFAFALERVADLVHLRPAVRAYWAERRAGEGGTPLDRRCLLTGELIGEAGLFPMVKGIPGGASSGSSLVGFNAVAFESYGWSGNDNAPISRAAAEAASTALRRLIDASYPDPAHAGQVMPRRSLYLGGNSVLTFWSGSAAAASFLDELEALLAGSDDQAGRVEDLYRSVWTGTAAVLADPSAFYALTLSGAKGRAAIRGWFATTIAEVAACVKAYFADLAVVRQARRKDGTEPRALPLRALLDALVPPGKSSDIPGALASDIVQAALHGNPLPIAVLQKALLRTRAEAGGAEWIDAHRRDARAALIKATLIRTCHQEVTEAMDSTNTNPGYLLGRLMAVIERMQQTALGDVNAGVVDRYFSGASATPAVVFPRLLKNMRNHAKKAKDGDSGAVAAWLEREADGVMSRLNGFPAYLSLEQQGFFVLGYHHERHWLWLPRAEREQDTQSS
jgi:CRISPR-associated protein Csd1